MFREMRRKDRKLETTEIIQILKKCNYGVLSIIAETGYAYGVPISYVYINNSIYIHSALEGNKIDSIKFNNNVSFCVVGDTMVLPDKFSTKYESVIAFGKAITVSGDEKIEALSAFIDKYSNQYIEKGKEYIKNAGEKTKIIKINIEYITGKARR
ncbi:MAG: putative flavin-nucleotide-binding protein [Firmicutes bacterium]|nr:putative flavin-nucleotide-binding protein [Bacillota bacterium]